MGVNGHWYVEIEKQAFWRGVPHTWVNRYILSGSTPTVADATSVMNALHGIEDKIHAAVPAGNGVGFVQARAYATTPGPPFATVNYNVSLTAGTATGFNPSGTGSAGFESAFELETCALVETKLTGLSTTGKPVYLRKFFRGCGDSAISYTSATPLPSSIISAVATLTAPWTSGLGGTSYVVIGSKGESAASPPALRPFLAARQVPKGRKLKKVTVTTAQVQAALNP